MVQNRYRLYIKSCIFNHVIGNVEKRNNNAFRIVFVYSNADSDWIVFYFFLKSDISSDKIISRED